MSGAAVVLPSLASFKPVDVVTTEGTNSSAAQQAGASLQEIVRRNRLSQPVGVYAVCSAHPQVIAAAAHEAHANGSVMHVESTSSQVNQFGGYTGSTPEQFAGFVHARARDAGLAPDRVLVGGDHLGPFPWRREPARAAMEKARTLVSACVLAGYQKIHLDASMACADDPKAGLDERSVAERAALLCETAENAFRDSPRIPHPCCMSSERKSPRPAGNPLTWNRFRSPLPATSNPR